MDDLSSDSDILETMVAAAMDRQYRDDSRAFLKSLASLLESILPGEAQVRRAGLFGGANRPVKRLEVSFRDPDDVQNITRYFIEAPGPGDLLAGRTRVVRSVALKTDTIPVAEWVSAVSAALARRAESSKATRDALRKMTNGY